MSFGGPDEQKVTCGVQSVDIDVTKFSLFNLHRMREEFRGKCEASDDDLARFLIARNGDFTRAANMLEAHLAWLRETPKPSMLSFSNMLSRKWIYVHGEDREHHPLMVVRICRHDVRNRDLQEMHRELLWWLDYALSIMPPNRSKFTVLIDRVNASSVNQDTEFVKSVAPIFQHNFPERSHRVIIYPSGLMFYSLWSVVQWFLDPVTRQKVCPQVSAESVFEHIDPCFVPQDMGGSCSFDPDISAMCDAPSHMHRLLGPLLSDDTSHGVSDVGDNPERSEGECMPVRESVADDEQSSLDLDSDSTYSFHTTRQTEAWPEVMRGWAVKEGHIIKNWKRRYFVLQSNTCSSTLRYYFQQDPLHPEREPYGLDLMGQLDLRGYLLEVHRRDSILHLYPDVGAAGKQLHLHLEDKASFELWIDAFTQHLQFREKTDRFNPPATQGECIIL